MEDYIKQLINLINFERKEEISLMINEIKTMSSYKREEKGRAINKLKGKFIKKELGLNIVQYGRSYDIITEINVGDIVLISTKNPLKSDLTGTVIEKGRKYIKVAFSNKVPKWALKKKVRLDLYVNDTTYLRMEDNLKNLSPFGINALNYLLGIKEPKFKDDDIYLEYIDSSLNNSQKEAVVKSLSTSDFYLIHGPFGTGKTRTLIEYILQEIRQNHKILACSDSNGSVDNILDRLIKIDNIKLTRLGPPQRVSKDNIKYTLAYQVENHPDYSKKEPVIKKIDELIQIRQAYTKPRPQFRRGLKDNEIKFFASKGKSTRGISSEKIKSMAKWLEYNDKVNKLYDELDKIEDEIIKDIIGSSDIILSTNSSAALESIKDTKFDLVVVDEASQTTIPSILIPISKARKFILAGDHKQLPPTVLSPKAFKLEETLFEILISEYPYKSQLLDVQYRMNSKLMDFPNKTFYNNSLKTYSKIKDINLADISSIDNEEVFSFLDTSLLDNNEEKQIKDSKSIINPKEADICLKALNYYLGKGISKKDIGIISPYLDQVRLIKDKCDVEVKTVDGFQGREKEIIIISTVRSNDNGNVGFLKDLRRLNVALTRAKRKLVIIGNANTLSCEKTYKDLIDYAVSNNMFESL
ncbi:IGHMBP2 family helicase [uncultured Methanobrevibacter sp.]|uniref:IGHMBP2 family helicase n=1 Tax=uncultured Methanobrevibacter sp. TaxID=253161 RepID=UPI0025E60D2A|nr:IGHMBP2 family helicase [uncultured Methanobrevibacter sp.]